jgi:uncharacterized protein YqgQ
MKCESLKPLPRRVKGLKPLTKQKFKRGKYLNEIEMILYSTNLCYYSWKILNHIITPPNRQQLLNSLSMEVYRMSKMLSRNDWYRLEDILTQKEMNEKFKQFGITKKSLEH